MTHGLRLGMAVFDRRTDMPGVIRSFAGDLVLLVRPSGHIWQASLYSVRPATEREQLQLRALARLHRQQRRPRDRPAEHPSPERQSSERPKGERAASERPHERPARERDETERPAPERPATDAAPSGRAPAQRPPAGRPVGRWWR
ncbi:hypothetical protein AB0O07_02255 [Streptomyces sp. NPDC093085]|uniref:hypothetical protein n=1 Tax=Streptomyces sp. NPDC093085 TaxID=3155068 RepID=UPI0034256A7D